MSFLFVTFGKENKDSQPYMECCKGLYWGLEKQRCIPPSKALLGYSI